MTLLALVMGIPQRPDLVQRISDPGSEYAHVPVERVSDVQFHDPSKGRDYYTSTAVVQLAPETGGTPVVTTVHPVTPDRPHKGSEVSVLYAPSRPGLGAVAGDRDSLGAELEGSTMGTGRILIVGIAWAFGIALSVDGLSLRHGFRSFSRLSGTDMAVRGTCLGPGFWERGSQKQMCLKVVTASSRTAHFLASVTEKHVPKSLAGQPVWLCWDARRSTDRRQSSSGDTPAALVSDRGWVMHGMLKADDAQMVAPEGLSVEKTAAGNGEPRALRLWNPHSAWLLYVAPSVLMLAVVAIGCAALLTFDITGVWRWVTGTGGALIGLVLCYLVTTAPHSSHPASETNPS
ncbi:hypothetical protein [Streptomyces sp. NPDC002790]|uniref:hypothetical protein n=1 Tax=Streptomyces sp. NPDC002790 TaxID=3154431 RepID=UPI003318ECA6